ncbi:uncharacterized protein LOC103873357, partial [Brassica rapa]|uniref:uncharacterized protein LOC103873357 n=1 Tax=Brassica campestris TaxID=3711 RepID=UPI00142D3AC3
LYLNCVESSSSLHFLLLPHWHLPELPLDPHRSLTPSSVDRFEVSNSHDNIHTPYYLHSSDHPGLVLVADSLDGSNYGVWIIAMTTSLKAKNKLEFVDGSIVKPQDDDPYFKIWCRCNSMIKSWLLNSVAKSIYTSILYFKNASEIWTDLHSRFHKSNLPRLYKLRHQLHSFRQGNLSLASYHTKTQSLWEELSNIQATNRSVEELLAERETNRIIDFLMGLNDNYETIRNIILTKKHLPSFSEIYNLLDQEDSQKEANNVSSLDVSTAAAFQVTQASDQHSGKTSFSGGQSTGYPRKDCPFCTFCHRPGHVIDKCYKKHGYPNSMKPNQKSERSFSSVSANAAITDTIQNDEASTELSASQIQQLVSFLSTKLQPPSSHLGPEVHSVSASIPSLSSTCPISGTFHPSITCSFTGIDRPYVCSSNTSLVPLNAWVIDSGATNHICHQKSSFLSFKPLPDTTVTLPNGVLVSIVGIGNIEMGRDLLLSDVLYIPQFKFNLLSVSCLTKSFHYLVWFDEFSCGIQEPTRGHRLS